MLYNERKELVLQQLQLKGTVKVTELASQLGVSLDTVRRDLKALEQEGQIKCVHGGACLPDALLAFSNFSGREIINIKEKRLAAVKAMSYVKNGMLLALNSGTTNVIIAQELIKRFSDLTVVTNNLAAATVLIQQPSIKTIFIGGQLDCLEHSTYGSSCEAELNSYFPDLCFLSINSVDAEVGYTDFRLAEIGVIRQLTENSGEVIAVMDSSKLDRRSRQVVVLPTQIDRLVMDRASLEVKKRYASLGIRIE